jgi:hypothetical protein
MSVTGFAIGVLGCSLSPERRIEVIQDESREARDYADRRLKKALRECRGDPVCRSARLAEHAQATDYLQTIRDHRINGELDQAHEAEEAFRKWLLDLTEPAKKLWEPLIEILRNLKKKEVKSDGTLTTSALRVLSSLDGSLQGGSDAEPLTQHEAANIAASMLTTPGSWEQAFRLQVSGSVALEVREGTETTLSDAIFSLSGIYDGELNPDETIGLTGGTVTLFGGSVLVRLSTVVGASQLRIHSNGNGFLRVAGFTEHADEWDDTDLTDVVILKIPVRLQGQSLVVSTEGNFMHADLLFNQPDNLIADYDGDGYVNSFDVTAFLADFNSSDDYADVNGDASVDQTDVDFFIQEYSRSIAWTEFWTDWSTAP